MAIFLMESRWTSFIMGRIYVYAFFIILGVVIYAVKLGIRFIYWVIHKIKYERDSNYRNEIVEAQKRAAEAEKRAVETQKRAAEAQKQAEEKYRQEMEKRRQDVKQQEIAKDLENALKTPHILTIIKKNAFLDAYNSYCADYTNVALYDKVRVLGKEYLTALVKLKGVRVKHVAYVKMLNLLQLDPANSTLHELTLSFGRLYYAEKRRNKKLTSDDETTLTKDIHAVTVSHAATVGHAVVVGDTVTAGDTVTVTRARRRAINRRRNVSQKQQTDEYIDEIEGNWTDN